MELAVPVVAGEAPIGFHPTAAQVQDPEAEFVMRSTGLSFKVFTILMPRTRNFIPQRTSKRRMLILSNTRLIVCHALFCVGVFFFQRLLSAMIVTSAHHVASAG